MNAPEIQAYRGILLSLSYFIDNLLILFCFFITYLIGTVLFYQILSEIAITILLHFHFYFQDPFHGLINPLFADLSVFCRLHHAL